MDALDASLCAAEANSVRRLAAAKLMRYATVGFLTLAVYLAVGSGLRWVGASVGVLGALAFAVAVAMNYLLQRVWVFSDSRPVIASLPKYVVMVAVGYALNNYVLTALILEMPLIWAQCAAALAVVASNAGLSFLWIFSTARDNRQ